MRADRARAGVAVDRSMTLTVIGRRDGWSASPVTTASYYLVTGTAPTPAFDPVPGSFSGPVSVRLATATTAAVVRYTVDGSGPGITSPVYLGPLLVDATTTIKARAFAPDLSPSGTATGTFTISNSGSVATPVLSPPPARYEASRLVTATSATPGASVRYTTDGVEPTLSDPEVGAGVLIDRALVLSTRGFKDGVAPSATRTGFYLVAGALASGEGHILALAADGVIWAFGQNNDGQLGDGTTTNHSTPAAISGLSNIVAVAAGSFHSLALDAQDRVWAWGSNSKGQIGDGTTTSRLVPQLVPGLTGAVAIAAGYANSFALLADGSLRAWGDNTGGILGDGTTTQRNSPVPVSSLSQVKAVSAGRFHTLALTQDGQAWSWGDNYYGALGDGSYQSRYTPAVVPGMTGVVSVAAGQSFSGALKSDGRENGSVWTWGLGSSGQLGYGHPSGAFNPRPGLVLDRVIALQAGRAHVLALTQDGRVLSWGEGGGLWGRLGDGVHVNRFQPVVVIGLNDAVSLSAGSYHSAAIHADGGVSAWGYNVPGVGSDTPVRVPGLTLVANQWLTEDDDSDRLTAWDEWRGGCDPYRADSNGDGIPDYLAVALGLSCSSLDTDGDGVLNADEQALGTSVTVADSDGDGVLDGLDCAPLDPTRSSCAADPNDHTPPTITLQEPPNATPLP